METGLHSPFKGVLQQSLGFSSDRIRLEITPALLKAHAAQRQHGHGDPGATEAAGRQAHNPHQPC